MFLMQKISIPKQNENCIEMLQLAVIVYTLRLSVQKGFFFFNFLSLCEMAKITQLHNLHNRLQFCIDLCPC
jgi:hypothetical protein